MQTYAQDYLPRLQSFQPELLERLETLVNIDSGTGQVDGVNQVIAHLEQWMTELGFTVTLHPVEKLGNNLLARLSGKGGLRLILVGHVDTVYPPASAQARPFEIRDGLAFGPGVIDMKSGVMMCIYALRTLLESGFDDFGEICVAFNNDEEVSSPGSTPLLREVAHDIDQALVLEPARSLESLTHSRKGTDKYLLEVTGRAAHSGTEPHRGRSAVIELAQKIIAISQLHSLFPGLTINITRLTSTEPLNVIPDKASCSLSVRAFEQRLLDRAYEALQQIVAGRSVPDTQTTLTRMPGRIPYTPSPGILHLVEVAQTEGRSLNIEIQAEPKGGVSDANTFAALHIPVLDSLGPTGGSMHNLQREFLRVDSLPVRGAMLAGLVQHLCLLKLTGS